MELSPQPIKHASYTLVQGMLPLLISVPHSSHELPPEVIGNYSDVGRSSKDSDWFTDLLYESIAADLRGSMIIPRYSRYLIDLNRPANDEALYPGQVSTGLCPTLSFDGEPLYRLNAEPDGAERTRRTSIYWAPYHQAIVDEMERLKKIHGYVVLWEGHSIKSEVPRLFQGSLPDFNLGSNIGRACPSAVIQSAWNALTTRPQWTRILDGRFKGGYITRQYGIPDQSQYAIQLELSQTVYLRDEHQPSWDLDFAQPAIEAIKAMVSAAVDEAKKVTVR